MANNIYWKQGTPKEDGIYEVYLGNNYYETRSFCGGWSSCWNPAFVSAEIIAWHKIPLYKVAK